MGNDVFYWKVTHGYGHCVSIVPTRQVFRSIPVSSYIIPQEKADKQARPFASTNMRPPSRRSIPKQRLWRIYCLYVFYFSRA